jgi:hypothetical protein
VVAMRDLATSEIKTFERKADLFCRSAKLPKGSRPFWIMLVTAHAMGWLGGGRDGS